MARGRGGADLELRVSAPFRKAELATLGGETAAGTQPKLIRRKGRLSLPQLSSVGKWYVDRQ